LPFPDQEPLKKARLFRFLPGKLRKVFDPSSQLGQGVVNSGWLLVDRILRMAIGLIVGIWVARYLGPEQFGLFNYAVAIVGLFAAVASLGLNGIVVRDLVKEPANDLTTLGTAFVLQIIGGGLAFTVIILVIQWLRPGDNVALAIAAILGLALVFKASEVVKYWFESQVMSKFTVIGEHTVFLIFSTVKIGLILGGASLLAFAWAALAEAAVGAAALLAIYWLRVGRISTWRWRLSRAKSLLADSWPLILSGITVMIYTRTDQIMLGQMLGDRTVGIYSAAVRISEAWYFVPIAIISSAFPALMRITDHSLFEKRFQALFDLMFVLALPVALILAIWSDTLITFLFGHEFIDASEVLVVYAWAFVFASLGAPSGRWYLYANLQKLALYRTTAGAVLNIVLNIWWIPRFGPVGAAYATLVSTAVSNVLFNAVDHRTRHLFQMQVRAASPRAFRNLANF